MYYYDNLDSTNIKAFELAKEGVSHGTLIVANSQNAGKGRRGRSWTSEPGTGIYMSLVLRPDIAPQQAPGLTLVAALSVALAIKTECEGLSEGAVEIKWPNDIILHKKKVCGILTEMYLDGTKVDFVIVGIGVNVHQKEFPAEIKATATSLDIETGGGNSKEALIEKIQIFFKTYYEKYVKTGDLSDIKQEYERHLTNINKQVKVIDPAGEYSGIAKGITEKGELIVETKEGIRYVESGEVSVRGIYGYV